MLAERSLAYLWFNLKCLIFYHSCTIIGKRFDCLKIKHHSVQTITTNYIFLLYILHRCSSKMYFAIQLKLEKLKSLYFYRRKYIVRLTTSAKSKITLHILFANVGFLNLNLINALYTFVLSHCNLATIIFKVISTYWGPQHWALKFKVYSLLV